MDKRIRVGRSVYLEDADAHPDPSDPRTQVWSWARSPGASATIG
ncbi:hypothetical protein [Streptomyces turgidiscabies]|uniref:Uncharacterized protein n=1 Tax=Streptomyces turgidiscabies TaxID=85558 RepID=A0ABU0RJH9_9ACTN|nr:hypothetical protein [Streptomyces turgidiscabies]MDQ0932155.1 hypothetical protein [Streptomyces turgidiscabies]